MSEKDRASTGSAAKPSNWQRRRRLAEVFGDVLPDVTGDEREPGEQSGDGGPGESASDRWLKSQVPPHHG